jgi:hypothetical protein
MLRQDRGESITAALEQIVHGTAPGRPQRLDERKDRCGGRRAVPRQE